MLVVCSRQRCEVGEKSDVDGGGGGEVAENQKRTEAKRSRVVTGPVSVLQRLSGRSDELSNKVGPYFSRSPASSKSEIGQERSKGTATFL